MYTIKENLRPIADFYDRYINGFYLSGLLQFKQQNELGGDYISKVWRAEEHQINAKYENAVSAVLNPTYTGFIKDNLFRLLFLNGVERLVSARQAASSLARIGRPNSLSFLFTEIMNDGAFRGTMRGLSLNFLQISLVLWPTVLINKNTKGGPVDFVGTYVAFDALLHPLDTLKNIMYANTAKPLGLREAFNKMPFTKLYSGVLLKAIFNIPFAGALYTTATGCEWSWAFWLATIAAYPLTTMKVALQTGGVEATGYRGVIPFALVNILFAWQLSALATPEKLACLKADAKKKLNRQ